MKRVEDYTNNELINMNDQEIAQIIDIECAYEGAPMLPELGECPQKPDVEPDLDYYTIGGFNVLKEEEALILLEALKKVTLYKLDYTGIDYDNKVLIVGAEYGQEDLKADKQFSQKHLDIHKDELEAYAVKKKQYDKDKSAYNSAAEERRKISDYVWERFHNALEGKRECEDLENSLKHYLKLADGSKKIAKQFLVNAHPDWEEKHPDLLNVFESNKKEKKNESDSTN